MLVACLLLALAWPGFLAVLFSRGDSIRGVLSSVVLMLVTTALLCRRAWPPLLLGAACGLALGQGLFLSASQARREWLYQAKLQQIQRARLAYCPEWGWVDRRHGLSEVLRKLQPGGRRQAQHIFFGSWGCYYQLNVECESADRWQTWNALLQIGERCEAEESRLPWYAASQLSAYNPDDLPSLYWTLFREAHPEVSFTFLRPGPSQTLWRQQGRLLLDHPVRNWTDFQPARPALRPLYRQLFRELPLHRAQLKLVRQGPFPL
jgi:hypothetical protein